MQTLRVFFTRLCLGATLAWWPLQSIAASRPDNVVLQYHFLGATALAQNTNVASARRIFALRSTVDFESLVFHHLSGVVANALHFQTSPEAIGSLRPLWESLVNSESVASMGGTAGQPLEFVLAIHPDKSAAQSWQQTLRTVNHGPGEAFQAGTFSGSRWNNGARGSFWMVPAGDWLVIGRGESLAPVRAEYLTQIQKSGRPVAAMNFNCFEADVDWPRLANWAPLSSCPLKLARTNLRVNADRGSLHLVCDVTYPEEIQWQPQPLNLPTKMVQEPLISFAMGRDVEPFLKSSDVLAAFGTDPFRDQFYFWAMGQMAFQSYAAWPAANPGNTMLSLSAQALDIFNPKLQKLDGSELIWMPKSDQLVWSKLQLVTPSVLAAPKEDGNYLVAGLFPLTTGTGPAPSALWAQFQGRDDLVYYDWELTGLRLRHLLTVTQVLPILKMLGIESPSPEPKPGIKPPVDARVATVEHWLLGAAPFLANTVTEVTKTGPNKLMVVRSCPMVFSSLELLILSHILSDTPAGPLDWNLLPQAKMSGPGVSPPR